MPEHDNLVADLIAERHWPIGESWKAAEHRLDRTIKLGRAPDEVRDRWARGRARLAMILIDPDGRLFRSPTSELR